MKKSTLLGFVAALFMGQSAMAQGTQEITYVEDPAQGYIFNSFSNNWFVNVEGGANYYFKHDNSEREFMDRFSPNAGLWIGKWFSPIIALRAGGNWTRVKGLGATADGMGLYGTFAKGKDDYFKFKANEFSAQLQAMLNLTNWWCGYRPGRCYNGILYAGVGYAWQYVPNAKGDWKRYGGDDHMVGTLGLINSFNLNKHIALYLDVRAMLMNDDFQWAGRSKERVDLQAYLGLTYNFNKTTWNAPVVPVIPEIPNCDAIEARLQAANGRIADLERQLRDCLNRPVQTVETKEGPLCTIYYTIGKSNISKVDQKVLGAVSEIMKSNPDTKYTVCGWADNYTGTDQINERLRHARANGVEKVLLKNGVNPSQLDVTVNNGNLNDLGEKYVSLDRAVTITENK